MAAGFATAFIVWNVICGLLVWKPSGYRMDAVQGRVYDAGLYVHGVEGFSWSVMDRYGMRGEAGDPDADTRVLFLGDSFTEALQVYDEHTFARGTAQLLEQEGRAVASINAGRSGASPAGYIELAGWYGDEFSPDVTVVQVSDQDFASDVLNPDRTFFLRAEGDSWRAVRNESFVSANPVIRRLPWVAPVLDVPVLRLGSDTLSKLAAAQRMKAAAPARSTAPVAGPDEELVHWMLSALDERYDRLVLLYLPTIDYAGDARATTVTERVVLGQARELGITVVNPRERFAREYGEHHVVATGFWNSTPGTGHLNASGHEMVAAELAPAVREVMER